MDDPGLPECSAKYNKTVAVILRFDEGTHYNLSAPPQPVEVPGHWRSDMAAPAIAYETILFGK